MNNVSSLQFSSFSQSLYTPPERVYSVYYYVDLVIEDSARLPDILNCLRGKNNENGDPQTYEFLLDLLGKRNINVEKRKLLINQIAEFLILSDTEDEIKFLMTDYSYVFVSLIKALTRPKRKGIIKQIVKRNPGCVSWFQVAFRNLANFKQFENPQEVPVKQFVVFFLNALTEKERKEWVTQCLLVFNSHEKAIFLLFLPDSLKRFTLQKLVQPSIADLTQGDFLPCIESMVAMKEFHENIHAFFGKILHDYPLIAFAAAIKKQYDKLSVEAQAIFFNAMTSQEQNDLLKMHSSDYLLIANLTTYLYKSCSTFEERTLLIELVLSNLRVIQTIGFITECNNQKSPIGPYIFYALDTERFGAIMFGECGGELSKLMNHSQADSTMPNLIQMFKESENWILCYENLLLDLQDDLMLIDSQTTMKGCYEIITHIIDCKDVGEAYHGIIQKIPPFFIGMLVAQANGEEIITLASYMEVEQLKFLVVASQEVCETISILSKTLQSHQWLPILQLLSSEQLALYTDYKIKELEKHSSKFNEQFNNCFDEFNKRKKDEVVFKKDWNSLNQQVNDLRLLANVGTTMELHKLLNYLDTLNLEEDYNRLERSMRKLSSKKEYFNGPKAIFPEILQGLESKIMEVEDDDEEDIALDEVLYNNFWLLLREHTLPYLGISPYSNLGIQSPGELTILGILSDQDLDYLGISQDRENKYSKLFKKLEYLLYQNSGGDDFKKLWDKLNDIKVDKEEALIRCTPFYELLTKRKDSLEAIKADCSLFYQELLAIDQLTDQEKKMLSNHFMELKNIDDSIDGWIKMKDILHDYLMAVRNHEPLNCLQRYLTKNKDLKITWERLHKNGCKSIADLFQKGYLKSWENLVHLDQISI